VTCPPDSRMGVSAKIFRKISRRVPSGECLAGVMVAPPTWRRPFRSEKHPPPSAAHASAVPGAAHRRPDRIEERVSEAANRCRRLWSISDERYCRPPAAFASPQPRIHWGIRHSWAARERQTDCKTAFCHCFCLGIRRLATLFATRSSHFMGRPRPSPRPIGIAISSSARRARRESCGSNLRPCSNVLRAKANIQASAVVITSPHTDARRAAICTRPRPSAGRCRRWGQLWVILDLPKRLRG
jgi:hypothetical protein